jgi:uncharacterized pyridoxal phosphate-dependent enzyme
MRRRRLLQTAGLAPLASALAAAPRKPDYLAQLGVRPIINGAGVYTMFTGSLMRPEVVEAIESMSRTFVRLNELHDAVGRRMAALTGAPAAMVTSGCAAALTLGTAAALTGDDPDKIQRIPDLTGMKNEVIIQKSHRFPYDHMVRNCGVKLIEVETGIELMKAINPRTAMLLFLNKADHLGRVKMREFVDIGKRAGVPTMNDCAADVPPVENLLTPIRLGFDLVCVSGGKGIRGPQSAGVLFGREDLIRAARLNSLPYSDTIGRSCKVNKEEMVGMMVALDLFLKEDHQALEKEWRTRVETMRSAIDGIPGVQAEPFVPEIANSVPHLRIRLDPAKRLSGNDLMKALRTGEPSIECVPEPYVAGTAEIASWMLQPGEAEIIAKRLREILSA